MSSHAGAIARLAAAFLFALVAGSFIVRAILPFPRIPQVRAKLDAFRKVRSCEVAFFGSSKTRTGVIPKRFDRILRERGIAVRSFNFGVDGMGFPESGYLCEKALAQRPGKLRWVFIETGGVRIKIPPAQRVTRRLVYWHDAPRTLAICRTILAQKNRSGMDEGDAGPLLREHLALFLRYASNAGEGAELLRESLLGLETLEMSDRSAEKERGYFAMAGQPSAGEVRRLSADLAAFQDQVRPDPEPVEDELLQQFARQVERSGATVIFLVPPNPRRTPTVLSHAAAKNCAVFAFDDPVRFPEFYRAENRGDWAHLNDNGARLFTAALAARFAEFLATERP